MKKLINFYCKKIYCFRWIASTQFESTGARKAFPCFDEPHFRTKFTLDVMVPDTYEVISNVKVTRPGTSET